MLIVCRTKAPRRELTVIGSQYQRVRRVEMPVKMGCSRQSASPWLVLPGMRSAVETESAVKKCSLAVIGEVSALASRNQDSITGEGKLKTLPWLIHEDAQKYAMAPWLVD